MQDSKKNHRKKFRSRYRWLSVVFLICIILIFSFNKYNQKNDLIITDYKTIIGSENDTIVAIIDSGIDDDILEHLGSRVTSTYNATDNSSNVNDYNGHGSSIASLIAYNDADFYQGINVFSNLIIIKVVDDFGLIKPEYISKGIIYAADNGANVINISLGMYDYSTEVEYAIEYAHNSNVIVVSPFSDGISDVELYPSRFEGVISVGVYGDSNLSNQTIQSIECMAQSTEIEVVMIIEGVKSIQTTSGISYTTAICTGFISLKLNREEVK